MELYEYLKEHQALAVLAVLVLWQAVKYLLAERKKHLAQREAKKEKQDEEQTKSIQELSNELSELRGRFDEHIKK